MHASGAARVTRIQVTALQRRHQRLCRYRALGTIPFPARATSYPLALTMKPLRSPFWRLLSGVFAVSCFLTFVLTGCENEPDPTTYVARVGDMVLTDDEVARSLQGIPAGTDTAEAREQIVEQWVTRSLLLQEAERLNLGDEPDVQGQIEQQERSILVTALTDRMYREAELAPSMTEIRNFFQSNRGQMTLREPFVRVRHLSTSTRDNAAAARAALQEAASAGRPMDSTFAALVNEYAEFPEQSRRLAGTFVPESRLFGHYPYVRDELVELGPDQISPVVEDDSLYHVLQLVERIPEGAEPELEWVEGEIRRRLMIRSRKQMYAREVQRLRNQALARNDLQFGEASVEEALAEEASTDTSDTEEATSPSTLAGEPEDGNELEESADAVPETDPPATDQPGGTEPAADTDVTDAADEETADEEAANARATDNDAGAATPADGAAPEDPEETTTPDEQVEEAGDETTAAEPSSSEPSSSEPEATPAGTPADTTTPADDAPPPSETSTDTTTDPSEEASPAAPEPAEGSEAESEPEPEREENPPADTAATPPQADTTDGS